MEKFKAAVLTKQHHPLEIVDLDHVVPSKGQVKIKMITSGLCGAQWNEINAVKGVDNYLPHLMGHEGYGEVVGIGDEVTKVKIGDYVVLHWRKGEGYECFGPKYPSDLGAIGSGSVTTFSDFTIVAENRISIVPKNDKLQYVYPLLGCALSTAWGVFNNELTVKNNSKIFIIGAGGLGLSFLFWAKLYGFKDVIVLDKYSKKEKYVETYDVTFYSLEGGFEFNDFQTKFDVIIDTTGDTSIISNAFNLLNKNGQFVLIGQPRKNEKLIINNALQFFDGIRFFASEGGGFDPSLDFNKIVTTINQNVELANKLISHIITLNEVNKGFDIMKSGDCARIIIDFNK